MHSARPPKHVAYGTAGFRDKAVVLPVVLYRVGLLAALRSRYLSGKTIGVMITASHNPPEDNGAKLVDPLGDMLEQSWEDYASELANTDDPDGVLDRLYRELKVERCAASNVIYARDTRESGLELTRALEAGLEKAGAHVTDFSILTTPQLHYLVRALNTLGAGDIESYGVPSEDGYYRKLVTALRAALKAALVDMSSPHSVIGVRVDCANGVGAMKLQDLVPYLNGLIDVEIVNSDFEHPEQLNFKCGADYVKTTQSLPANMSADAAGPDKVMASFDGDADRLIMYYTDKNGRFHLLDGDKIATLVAAYLRDLVKQTGTHIEIGVVQTAYANGASTAYLESEVGVPVVCTPTGVKHLHHAAQQFGIGVYFEANGHGTVLFEPGSVRRLQQVSVHTPVQKRAVDTLLAFSDLINQTVGDAISDLLFVLATLVICGWTPADWDKSYTDLPNRLLKAAVADRTAFKTTDAERRLVEPEGLQKKLDELMAQYPRGRTFVRASGTEDVVRIYAEAATAEAADELAERAKALVTNL